MREGIVLKALSLFSCIGGLDIAAHAAGIETVGFCEIEPFAVKVLERRFPGVENHGDIARFTNRTLRELGGSPFHRFKCPADYNGTIDVVHGGFPCQDLSVAGKQRGLSGERSGLWFEMLRVISELRPAYVLAENVRGAVNLALDTVRAGMEGEGYEVRTLLLPAAAFGAPHQRERLFVIGVRSDVADGLRSRSTVGFPRPFQGEEGEPAIPLDDGAPSGKLWPTPHRNCSNGAGAHGDGGLNIQTAVSLWPTPTSGKLCGGTGHLNMLRNALGYEEARKLSARNGGQLSADWVEALMGFPLGWTDLECEEPEMLPWPALMGQDQYPYEPPRTCTGIKNRAARLKALGNAVVPQQAYPFFEAIAIMDMVSSTVRKREEEDGKNGS